MRCCLGCCFSCEQSEPFSGVRVMHIDGHVEGFEAPITASEVTGKPTYQLLFSPVQLLSGSAKPLQPDDLLEPGRMYFLLPDSVLQAGGGDVAVLAAQLKGRVRRSAKTEPAKGTRSAVVETTDRVDKMESGPRLCRDSRWRPVLDTIRELSFRLTVERLGSRSRSRQRSANSRD
ncbi:hypothetical protein HPP92_016404 [Vanilla planifolia]|uniref:DUF4228 domain-containing protein n=1 Tax=Vanilla planifolia TaxID=51239 RepID=A0A835QNL7_VANPL|nr:hypothetical protein HPP92_017039 [Vanilla planifolia]KAG0471858.1 hypothetical protein HPP92_016404 [Vanilla planifolia]